MKRWIVIMTALAVAGCAGTPENPQIEDTPAITKKQEDTALTQQEQETSIDPQVLYLLMAAELAGQRNQYGIALDGYLQAAKLVDDPRIAERAAKIALFLKDPQRTEEAVNIWLERDSGNLTARKIATLSAIRNANKKEAVEHLNASLELDPAGFEATLLETSKLMEKDGREAFVYEVLEELSQEHPEQASIFFVQALLASKMHKQELAREKNSIALQIQPNWKKAMIFQAQLAGRAGDLDEARSYLERALDQAPEDERVRKMLAQVLVESKAYDDAIDLYQKVLDETPEDGESRFAIALIYLQQKEYDEAEPYLEALLDDPVWESRASFYLGRIEYEREHFNDALVWFDRVAQQGPLAFDARMAAVSLLLSQKRYDEAAGRIAAMEVDHPEQKLRVLLVKAEVYSELGQRQKAFDILSEALRESPKNRDILYTRALMAEQLDRLDVLESDLLKILANDPNDAGALNALGYTLVDRTDRYAEAEVYLQKALQLKPEEAVIIDSYGWLQFKLGNTDKALSLLRKAYEKQPEHEIAAHLAELLWVIGEREKARDLIESALRKAPEDRYLLDFKKRFLQNSE